MIDKRQIKILITRIEEGLQMFDKGLERLRTKGKYYRLNEKKGHSDTSKDQII